MIMSIAILLIAKFAEQKQIQMALVVGFGLVYAGWGIMHHRLHHSLRARIVLEYSAVAALGIAIVLFIMKSLL